jgi:hypothetical protein
VASARAYLSALNKMLAERDGHADVRHHAQDRIVA